jgi:hypothetical protein
MIGVPYSEFGWNTKSIIIQEYEQKTTGITAFPVALQYFLRADGGWFSLE